MISKIYKGKENDIYTEEKESKIDKETWDYLSQKMDPRKEIDAFIFSYNLIVEEKNLKDPEYLEEVLRTKKIAEDLAKAEEKAKNILEDFVNKK